MPKFHSLKIREVRRETADSVSLSFEVPDELKAEYAFLPGQHLTLKTILDGEEIRRSYSICTAPSEGDLRVAVKKLPFGKFSKLANEVLQPGETLDVMTPMGSFTPILHPSNSKHYVAIAVGSGITPIISILKTVLETEPGSFFTLIYGNRTTESVIFRDQIDELKNANLRRLSIHHVMSQEDPGSDLFFGRIDAGKCHVFFTKLIDLQEVDEFFICGPAPMTSAVKDTLLNLGVHADQIHFELFSTVGQNAGAAQGWQASDAPVVSRVTITIDDNTFSYDHASATETVLDAAHRTGADLPYACKGGVCCTCRAKVLKGSASMEVCYGLEPSEVAAGYVLTCQAHPTTDTLVLSFDE